jgi:hypothetical protein
MSHWAEIDENNKVIRVLVGDNNEPDEGESFMNSLGGTWVKTSYNSNIRGVYAGIGFTYNETEDIFITPQPYPSWIRTGSFWNPPVPRPTDDKRYTWDEETTSWVEVPTV